MEERVYLSLGSNLGDREANIRGGLERLSGILLDFRASQVYESRPLYVEDQPLFLNTAATGIARISPRAFLRRIHEIEADFGRNRQKETRMGPRTLDIDILLYGSRLIHGSALTIPHPRLCERAFALVPLLELSPELRDPLTGRSYREALEAIGDRGVYSLGAR